MQKLKAYIEERNMRMHHVPTSGHADKTALLTMIHSLKPTKLLPIHTFAPRKFSTLTDTVVMLQDGETLEV